MRELALHILDIAQNSLSAGAKNVSIEVDEQPEQDRLTISICDDGSGMDAETVTRVLDPFVTSRKTRRVGLGLPLFAAAAQRCEGDLTIKSAPGRGTRVEAWFSHSHIDRAPLGDIPTTIATLVSLNPQCDFVYIHRRGQKELQLSTLDIRRQVGDVPLDHPEIFSFISQYLQEGMTRLGVSGS